MKSQTIKWNPISSVPIDTLVLLWPFNDFGKNLVVTGYATNWPGRPFEDAVEGYAFDTATHWAKIEPPEES